MPQQAGLAAAGLAAMTKQAASQARIVLAAARVRSELYDGLRVAPSVLFSLPTVLRRWCFGAAWKGACVRKRGRCLCVCVQANPAAPACQTRPAATAAHIQVVGRAAAARNALLGTGKGPAANA